MFWGKLERETDSGQVTGVLPLHDHCVDVASVFRALCDLPGFGRALDRLAGKRLESWDLDRLAVLALLHDLGKCNWGFQAKRAVEAKETAGHTREAAHLLDCRDEDLAGRIHQALDAASLSVWFDPPGAINGLLIAAVSHHGRPAFWEKDLGRHDFSYGIKYWRPKNELDPVAGLRELMDAARRSFPEAFNPSRPPTPVATALEHQFAGLVMLADWIGSHREAFFPFEHQGQRSDWARGRAKAALAAIGLDGSQARAGMDGGGPDFESLFGFAPYPIQAALGASDLPPLLVAESDTGSGKTEAALAHFLALFASGEVDGLYFALPTRVAARELYDRVRKTVSAVFGPAAPPVLLAAPGYVKIDGEPPDRLPPETRLNHDDRLMRRERTWAAERPKRFLAATVAVGTIDQVLLSGLMVPHAHLRRVCLNRSLLVVDEVHSSDVYMRYLTRRVLAHHLAAGGRALLLSATLGEAARREYLNPTGSAPSGIRPYQASVQLPYPALSAAGREIEAMVNPKATGKKVRLEPRPDLETPDRLPPDLAQAVGNGRRVLVILNTVRRAVDLFKLADRHPDLTPFLFDLDGVRCPHHGRFARADREMLDRAVTDRMGKASPDGPILLIGTQTLEQSLDIDADWLVTDLCPMDVLLQRIGRLHRHDRGPRPEPVCTVLTTRTDDLSDFLNAKGDVRGAPAGLGLVYEDLRIVQLTRDLVAEAPVIDIPTDNRRLVESATHPERLAGLAGPKWDQLAAKMEGTGLADKSAAHNALIPDEHFGTFMFPDIENEILRTRLGLDDRRLLLGGEYQSPFGQWISEIKIPGHMAGGLDQEQADAVDQADGRLIIHAGTTPFRYSRFGLEKDHESAD